MDEGTPPEPEGSFVDYQTTMVKFSKAIAITAQEMVSVPSVYVCFCFGDVNVLVLMSYVLLNVRHKCSPLHHLFYIF